MKCFTIILFFLGCYIPLVAQNPMEFKGQVSAYGSFNPHNELNSMLGARYIPEINYNLSLQSAQNIDINGAANIYGSTFFYPFDTFQNEAKIKPYRIWGRYTRKQFEFRIGLQKIDFGSAAILRPLQWFNGLDPRDPLNQTNGVYAGLIRYYFLNNTNIWFWSLYGNEDARGFDVLGTYNKQPEYGGRIQLPVNKGEVALSYHHRTSTSEGIMGIPQIEKIPENRIGLDGKWDIGVGLWFEASYIKKTKSIGLLTNQTLITAGTDYTFNIGNGLNLMGEHLVVANDEKAINFAENVNISAFMISYPLQLFDNLSSIAYYIWDYNAFSFFLNYQHQFKKITSYLMVYYNPKVQSILQQSEFTNSFSGPGVRIMLVYNY